MAQQDKRPIVVFVLGGPGAGKGTQCEKIQNNFGFYHISAGDCLREERSTPNSEYGQLIDEYIKEGKIVPVSITVELLLKKMRTSGWEGGKFLIDGFPRNLDNRDGWEAKITKDGSKIVNVALCLFFDCTEEEMEKRLLSRGQHSGRTDDNIESIKKRFKTFQNDTMPIVEGFEKEGKLAKINGMRGVDEVWIDVSKIFKDRNLA